MEMEKSIYCEFETIREKYQGRVKDLDDELSEYGYIHTLLNLRQAYGDYISELEELIEENEYMVPYEIYDVFSKVSSERWNLLLSYAEYMYESGGLAGAFLKEAVADMVLGSIPVLLQMEQINNYEQDYPAMLPLSIQAYDAILETLMEYKDTIGYALSAKDISEEYAAAAQNILLYRGDAMADKAYQYYTTALTLLKSTCANSIYHHGGGYSTYYITLYGLLYQYQSDIREYDIKCDFDINQEISKCLSDNYREAQSFLESSLCYKH